MDEDRSPMSPEEDLRPNLHGARVQIFTLLVVALVAVLRVLESGTISSVWLPLLLIVLAPATALLGFLLLLEYRAAQESLRSLERAKKRSTRTPVLPHQPPSPFRHRLATFLQVPEESVLTARPRPVSSMPFWSSVPLSPRPIVMKSAEFIRAVLERIHAAIRG